MTVLFFSLGTKGEVGSPGPIGPPGLRGWFFKLKLK